MDATAAVPLGLATADPLLRLEALYREHATGLTGLARLLVDEHGSADELVQDAFVGLHRHWHRLRDVDAAPAYLRSAVINGARSRHRRKRPELARMVTSAGAGPDETAVARVEGRAVAAAVRRLPQRQRECVVLRYYLDLADGDIARALGVSVGSVKTHLHRAHAALGVQLEDLR